MPSQLHESHLLLFRNQPTLAADLIRGALGAWLPEFTRAQVVSADLTDIQPAEYRADMVIQLSDDEPVYGIIIEVQLSADNRKRFIWPAYVANLRARLKCPVSLLVVTADEAVARWAGENIQLGGLHQFKPYVLGPSGIPRVTDEALARDNPELAVLSAMAHGRDANVDRALEIAFVAQKASAGLDPDRSTIYCDLITRSLGKAARYALNSMDPQKYVFKSGFARKYIALGMKKGEAKGEARGRAAVVMRLLALRFGPLDSATTQAVRRASISELEAIAERLLTARTLQQSLQGE